MELKDLTYFIEVANYGSFTQAAVNTFISQPTLSKSVKKMETTLQVALFERSTRSLQLTDAGEIVYEKGMKVLAARKELMTTLDDLMHLPTGDIKIGVPPLIGTLFFPTIAKDFGETHAHVSLELIEYGAKRIEQLVEGGQADVGMIVLPADAKKFHVTPFMKEEFMLFTHPNHRLANREEVKMEELQEEGFVLFNRDFALHDLIIHHCMHSGFTPKVVYESSQWDLIVELVSEELGITLLPRSTYKKMNQQSMNMIPLVNPPMWELGIITRKDSYHSFALKALLQFLSKDVPE